MHRIRRLGLMTVCFAMCLQTANSAEALFSSSNRFIVRIASEIVSSAEGVTLKLSADSDFTYSLIRTGRTVTVIVHQLNMTLTNSTETTEAHISRDEFLTDGQNQYVRFEL